MTLESQAGEPLLAFHLIRYIVPRAKEQAKVRDNSLDIIVTTNLAFATDEMLLYVRDEGIEAANHCWIGHRSFIVAIVHDRDMTATSGQSTE